jgi:hypothetical protein
MILDRQPIFVSVGSDGQQQCNEQQVFQSGLLGNCYE